VLRDGWQPSTAALPDGSNSQLHLWKHDLSGAMFPDAYNPFALPNVPGDWSWLDTKRVDMGPYFRRRGLIFVDGNRWNLSSNTANSGMCHCSKCRHANQPPRADGLPSRTRGGPIMQEIGGSSDARFWVEHQGNVVHLRVPTANLASAKIEITTREQAFAPRRAGLGFIRIKGITFQHAGNGFPPPQHGLVSTNGGHHWIIEGNTIEWANGMGLDIGSQHWSGPRNPLAGDSTSCAETRFGTSASKDSGAWERKILSSRTISLNGSAGRMPSAPGRRRAPRFHRAQNLLFRRNVVRTFATPTRCG
jgi:hypothetical protein